MQNFMEADQNVWGAQRSSVSYQQYALLKKMRIWSDYASYQWQSKVVGYNAESQQSWLTKFGIHSVYSMVIVLFVSIAFLIAGYFVFIFYHNWKSTSEVERIIERFSKGLQPNWRKQTAETVSVWMQRLGDQIDTNEAQIFEKVAQLHQKIKYAPQHNQQDKDELKRMLKTCSSVLNNKRKFLSK
jgi:hypothetical protein